MAGKSLAFLPARCFFSLFCVCLCASCGLFCGVGGCRFVAGWVGLDLVVGGFVWVLVMVAGGVLVMCGGYVWCSVSIGDSLWRFFWGVLAVSSISLSSPHSLVGMVGLRGVEVV